MEAGGAGGHEFLWNKKMRIFNKPRECVYAKLTELSLSNFECQLGTRVNGYALEEECLADQKFSS